MAWASGDFLSFFSHHQQKYLCPIAPYAPNTDDQYLHFGRNVAAVVVVWAAQPTESGRRPPAHGVCERAQEENKSDGARNCQRSTIELTKTEKSRATAGSIFIFIFGECPRPQAEGGGRGHTHHLETDDTGVRRFWCVWSWA